jgi:hypothetical protein
MKGCMSPPVPVVLTMTSGFGARETPFNASDKRTPKSLEGIWFLCPEPLIYTLTTIIFIATSA